MFGKKKKPPLDVNEVVGAAMRAFMAPDAQAENSQSANHHESRRNGGGLGSFGAVAIGAAVALTARAAYSRARQKLDLERVADAVEQRLSD
jgi:homoserine kinase